MVESTAKPVDFRLATLTGKVWEVSMDPNTTFKELAKQVSIKDKVPLDEVLFLFNEEKIVDLN